MEILENAVKNLTANSIDANIEFGTVYVNINDMCLQLSQTEIEYQSERYLESLEED